MHFIVFNNKKGFFFSTQYWHLANCEYEISESHKSVQSWLLYSVHNKLKKANQTYNFRATCNSMEESTAAIMHILIYFFVLTSVITKRIWQDILITQKAAIRNSKSGCSKVIAILSSDAWYLGKMKDHPLGLRESSNSNVLLKGRLNGEIPFLMALH